MTLIVKAHDVFVEHRGKTILDIPDLEVYEYDRIGLVGVNGVGKTTLLRILAGRQVPDEGTVATFGSIALIDQLDQLDQTERRGETDRQNQPNSIAGAVAYSSDAVDTPASTNAADAKELSRLSVAHIDVAHASGGEITRMKIAKALSQHTNAIFADEPTSHLDRAGITDLASRLTAAQGALVVISHNRAFLDAVVDKIWELENGTITEYWGTYSDYRTQKREEDAKRARDYEAYLEERARLNDVVREKKKEAARIQNKAHAKKNADAGGGRLAHQKSQGSKEKKLHIAAKSFEKKLEALEDTAPPPPSATRRIKFKQPASLELHNRFPIVGEDVTLRVGATQAADAHTTDPHAADVHTSTLHTADPHTTGKTLLDGANFEIPLGAKVAFVGPNGCGKSTLFEAIMNQAPGITVAPKAQIGYFSQVRKVIDSHDTVIAYLEAQSDYSITDIRAALAAVGLTAADVGKRVDVLSGGQIVKLSLVKTLLGRHNILLLDEPDNYLDTQSIEALEHMIADYAGTILFISHDQVLLEHAADVIYEFVGPNLKPRENVKNL